MSPAVAGPWAGSRARHLRVHHAAGAAVAVGERRAGEGAGRDGALSLHRRTVSPAPVAERRIGSSNADRIAGSGGGEADRVLQCGPYRRLRWRRGGSGPPMRTVSPAPVPEDATGSPSWSASRRDSPLPSWEPGRPEPAAVVDALRSPGRAPTSRPAAEASAALAAVCRTVHAIQRRPWPPTLAARQPRGLSSWSAGLGVLARFARAAAGRGGGWRVGAVVAGGLRSIGNGYGYVHGNGTVASRRGVPLFVVKNPGEESP